MEKSTSVWIVAVSIVLGAIIVAGALFFTRRDGIDPASPGIAPPAQAREEMEAALANAAAAQESYRSNRAPGYATVSTDLEAEGLAIPVEVSLHIVAADHDSYCMEATHSDLASVYYRISSSDDEPMEGRCG